jgi:multidrug efflux pump subunit AcrA (membrane-fusion protein)
MAVRWGTWIRRFLRATAVAVLGLAVGIGVRAWIIPRLPASLARFAGMPAAGSKTKAGTDTQGGREVALWKSSMIPNFVSPRPGKDPMGMELIPVYADELGQEQLITLDPKVERNMGLRTTPVRSGPAERVIRTVGKVEYAEPLLGDVTLKVGGWIEALYVDYVGQRVEKGQPLFSVYSPELISAQEEYLISLRPRPSSIRPTDREQVFPSREKLRYWDIPDSEIEGLKRRGHPEKAVTFVSPFAGWVIEKHALKGMHMAPGTRFFRIADLSTIWVYMTIYEYQLPRVQVGQPVRLELPYRPGEVFRGKVIYVYPYVDPKTRQIRVRLEFPNPELKLKPEMYANVEIQAPPGESRLLVPRDAVIDIGRRERIDGVERHVGYAYARVSPGRFEPRKVVIGVEVEDGGLQLLSGLKDGEAVVVSGQFQLDSERKVKEANLRMLSSNRTDTKRPPASTPSASGSSHPAGEGGDTKPSRPRVHPPQSDNASQHDR